MRPLLFSLAQLLLFSLFILGLTKPLGSYLFRVFEGEQKPLPRLFGPLERADLPLVRSRSKAPAHLEGVRAGAAGV
jgi:K+-transporting ATPase A subunit